MKKLLGILVLSLLLSGNAYAKEMLSIEEYYKQHKKTEPATLTYLGSRCSALFLLNSDLLKKTDKEISDIYMRASSDTSFFAGEVLRTEFGHTEEEAIKNSFGNMLKMKALYEKDAQDNYVRTGQYILGSYMEKDGIHCQKFHELVIDWIKGN